MKPLDDVQIKQILDAKRTRHPIIGFVVGLSRVVLQCVLAIAVLAGAWWATERLVATKPEVAKRPPRERIYTIRTVPAQLDSHQPHIRAFGQIAVGRQVELRALVAGKVTHVHPELKPGATIEAGEVLVTIDEFDYVGAITEARANLAEAEARLVESKARLELERDALQRSRDQLAFAVRDQERIKLLHKRGRVTDRDLDERNLLVSQREELIDQRLNNIAIEEARARQQEAGILRLQWGVRDATRDLNDTALRAPFRGVVLTENAEIGRTLNENDVAVSLYEADALEARFQLTDKQYGDILAEAGEIAGRPLEIYWYVGDEPVRIKGTIIRAGAEISADRGGVEVYATLDRESLTEPIRPGAFIEVIVPGRRYPGTFRLPETVLYNDDHVFIDVDGRLVRRDVKIVGYDEDAIILKGDLKPGDRVLATRIAEVGEGLKVRREGQAPADAPAAGVSGQSRQKPAPPQGRGT